MEQTEGPRQYISETVDYDVIIIGGGVIGLSTAYEAAVRRGLKTLVLEQFNFGNQDGSSSGFGRQFRICYPEDNFCKLAVAAGDAWQELNRATGAPVVRYTGTLWFGDPDAHNAEGNIPEAIKTMKANEQPFQHFKTAESLQEQFPWLTIPKDAGKIEAMYVAHGGVVDLQVTINAYLTQLWGSDLAVLLDNVSPTKIKVSDKQVQVDVKDKFGTCRHFHGKKLVLVPGVYVNNVLKIIEGFDQIIHLDINKWASTYFYLKPDAHKVAAVGNRLPYHSSYNIPHWIYFGKLKNEGSGADKSTVQNANSFYGFPSERGDHHGDLIRVAPDFNSSNKYLFHDFLPSKTPKVDLPSLKFTGEWVKDYMHKIADPRMTGENSTCYACFAKLINPLPNGDSYGPGQGFVLDFIPNTHNNVVLFTGGWAGKFIPLFGRILVDLCLHPNDYKALNYYKLIEPMNITRGILKKVHQDDNDKDAVKHKTLVGQERYNHHRFCRH